MNIVDIIIILLIIVGGFVGYKKGFTRQLVDTVGVIVVIVLSFLLKGYVSGILYKFMPFFEFKRGYLGISAMNLLIYEIIAFVLVILVFSAILSFLRSSTSIFEKMLNATIILGIPSKICGFFVGLLNNFIFVFIGLYILSLPVLKMTAIQESKVSQGILSSTPVLSSFCESSVTVFKEMFELLDEYQVNPNRADLNQRTIELFIEADFVDKDTVNELIESGKLTNAKIIE